MTSRSHLMMFKTVTHVRSVNESNTSKQKHYSIKLIRGHNKNTWAQFFRSNPVGFRIESNFGNGLTKLGVSKLRFKKLGPEYWHPGSQDEPVPKASHILIMLNVIFV